MEQDKTSGAIPPGWIGGFAQWDTLGGAVFADSPLVKTRQYFAGGVAVAWIVGESTTKVEVP